MSSPVKRTAIMGSLLKKEMRAYSRDKLYVFLTLLTLVFVVVIYWIVPSEVDETITLAVSPPISTLIGDAQDTLREMGATDAQLAELENADLTEEQEGLKLVEFESEEQMTGVVEGELEVWETEDGTYVVRDEKGGDAKPENGERVSPTIGIAFPPAFIADVATGDENVEVTVYADANVPEEIQGAMESFVREAAYQLAGQELPATMPDDQTIVLGEDRVGDQASLRDKMRPMIVFMILLMETFSLAALVSTEVLQRTVTAILVTPAKIADFLTAKTIFGTSLGFTQGVIVLALVGGFTTENWSLVTVTILMGAVMFTGVALFVGAAGKDFIGQLFYSMLFVVPMLIPAFSVFFPGSVAAWVRAIPTYPIIDILVGATIYDLGWADSWGLLAYAAAWLLVLYGAGLIALKRKVESL